MKGLIGESGDKLVRVATGLVSAGFCTFFFFRGRLFKKWDVRILLLFFLYVFGVCLFYYGFSYHLFTIASYFLWMNLGFLFLAFRTVKDPDRVLKYFTITYVAILVLLECVILVHATLSLKEAIPGSDRLWGCFRVGRLCGMTNANTLSFHAMTAAALAMIQWLKGNARAKLIYGIALFLQWFIMGMTNCRTTILSLSVCFMLFLFAAIYRRNFQKPKRGGIRACVGMIVVPILVPAILLLSFLLPTTICRGGISLVANATRDQQLKKSMGLVYERNVTDVDTLADRKLIWERSLELIFMNPRRTLLGTSLRSPENVNGAYEGRHDIPMLFAHNSFLEIFRKLGFTGLCFWIILLCLWGRKAISVYLDAKRDLGVMFLMASGAGCILTGMTEMGPFPFYVVTAVPLLFFICCGYCMRGDEDEKA